MTITISRQAYDELLYQQIVERSQHPDPEDLLDIVYQFPPALGQGYWREIQLREGLELTIGNLQLRDRLITKYPEGETWLEYHFHFSGVHQDRYHCIGGGQYVLYGSGFFAESLCDSGEREPYLEIVISIQPKLLYSFAGDREGQLPSRLQLWIRPAEQELYSRLGTANPAMQTVAKQIIQCSYQGIAKRIYFESKALELMAMLIEQEISIGGGDRLSNLHKSDAVDRIHYARDILLQQLQDPPSLAILAKQVGLNECSLKQGFRQTFGTTVFGYLHNYRLEQAKQMLEAGTWKVGEAARIVGYKDITAFGRAFRQKFGMLPRDYLKKYSVLAE
jgi:AraC-like DNA-binding protein